MWHSWIWWGFDNNNNTTRLSFAQHAHTHPPLAPKPACPPTPPFACSLARSLAVAVSQAQGAPPTPQQPLQLLVKGPSRFLTVEAFTAGGSTAVEVVQEGSLRVTTRGGDISVPKVRVGRLAVGCGGGDGSDSAGLRGGLRRKLWAGAWQRSVHPAASPGYVTCLLCPCSPLATRITKTTAQPLPPLPFRAHGPACRCTGRGCWCPPALCPCLPLYYRSRPLMPTCPLGVGPSEAM